MLEGPVSVSTFILLQGSCWWVAESCPTLCHSMDCSLPGSSVRGISQASILEWVAISFSRGSSRPRDQICIPRIGRWIVYLPLSHQGSSLQSLPHLFSLGLGLSTCGVCLFSPESVHASGLFGDMIVASPDRIWVAIWGFTAFILFAYLLQWTQIKLRVEYK